MKFLALMLAFFMGGTALGAQDMQVGGNVTGTVKVAGLDVPRNQIVVSPKAAYVHIIWDAFAERAAIKQAGKAFSLTAAALDLVKTEGLTASPRTVLFKVDVAEFPVRDDYGAPRLDKIEFLGRYVISRSGDKWVVKKR